MKVLNASIFSFIILNLVKKSILDFYVTTATAICLKEVIYSCLRRALERKIMETLKALILTIIVLNLVSKGLFLLYCHITDPSISYRTLWYRQPVVLQFLFSACYTDLMYMALYALRSSFVEHLRGKL